MNLKTVPETSFCLSSICHSWPAASSFQLRTKRGTITTTCASLTITYQTSKVVAQVNQISNKQNFLKHSGNQAEHVQEDSNTFKRFSLMSIYALFANTQTRWLMYVARNSSCFNDSVMTCKDKEPCTALLILDWR